VHHASSLAPTCKTRTNSFLDS